MIPRLEKSVINGVSLNRLKREFLESLFPKFRRTNTETPKFISYTEVRDAVDGHLLHGIYSSEAKPSSVCSVNLSMFFFWLKEEIHK